MQVRRDTTVLAEANGDSSAEARPGHGVWQMTRFGFGNAFGLPEGYSNRVTVLLPAASNEYLFFT